jgi:argininosuccinate lyase
MDATGSGGFMAETERQAALVKEIQLRFDRKLKENEITLLEYWKEQLERVGAMKPEGVAALQLQVKNISEMMANRIRMLKRG